MGQRLQASANHLRIMGHRADHDGADLDNASAQAQRPVYQVDWRRARERSGNPRFGR
jgi:hypothetical protein